MDYCWWEIPISTLRILSLFLSPVMALVLFFAKTLRFQRVILGTVFLLFTTNFAILFLWDIIEHFVHLEASLALRSFGWLLHNMKPLLAFYAVIIVIASIGYFVSNRRISHREKSLPLQSSSDPTHQTLLRQTVPFFGIGKICSLTCVSLLAIGVLAFARKIMVERYFFGMPVDLPGADYGKCISHTREVLMITVDKDGGISSREKILSPTEFEALLAEILANKPRSSTAYIDGEGRLATQESVEEISVHLRVDQRCSYQNLRRVLNALREQNIRRAHFRVSESR